MGTEVRLEGERKRMFLSRLSAALKHHCLRHLRFQPDVKHRVDNGGKNSTLIDNESGDITAFFLSLISLTGLLPQEKNLWLFNFFFLLYCKYFAAISLFFYS